MEGTAISLPKFWIKGAKSYLINLQLLEYISNSQPLKEAQMIPGSFSELDKSHQQLRIFFLKSHFNIINTSISRSPNAPVPFGIFNLKHVNSYDRFVYTTCPVLTIVFDFISPLIRHEYLQFWCSKQTRSEVLVKVWNIFLWVWLVT